MSSDRTVHARGGNVEVVRYDRAGKWWLESIDGKHPRKPVTLNKAALVALDMLHSEHGQVFFGKPGGGAFDRQVLTHA